MVKSSAESQLGAALQDITALAGGDTSAVFRANSARGMVVLKVRRELSEYPANFFAESQGLALLREVGALTVPDVWSYGTAMNGTAAGGWSYLLLSYLAPAPQTPEQQTALGRGLAALHRATASQFGGTPDNFFGALPQTNPAAASAAEFFWRARLEPQMELADGSLSDADRSNFAALRAKLATIIPPEPPALVHGDLWHGNALYTVQGPALIDPAATYSHREVDLSLMLLFGGFDEQVFEAYAAAYPLAEGWQARANLWNLYPLLAHFNMFGGDYLARTRAALAQALKL